MEAQPAGGGTRSRGAGALCVAAVVMACAIGVTSSNALADLDLPVVNGDRVVSRLDPVSEVERHRVDCGEGTLVTVVVASSKLPGSKKKPELRVRLLDDDGAPLTLPSRRNPGPAEATGKRVSFRKVRVPSSGVITVEVSSADEAVTGPVDYKLSVKLKAQKKWSERSLAVSPTEPGLLTFAATTGATVRFNAKAAKGVGPTYGRVLLDSQPTGIDFTDTPPREAEFVAPQTGTYELEVFGASDGVAAAKASVAVPKTPRRKLDATGFANSATGASQVLAFDAAAPAELEPVGDGLDGLKVGIPAGAFPSSTVVFVAPAPALDPVGDFTVAGPAISISASAAFRKDATVTLTLPFNASAANGDEAAVAVTVRDDSGVISQTSAGLTVDLEGGTVSLPVSHFSIYQVVAVAVPATISVVAGTDPGAFSGDGGPATAAGIVGPNDVAVAATGALYITDQLGHRIRFVDPLGVISTFAGDGTAGFSGDGGPASAARLNNPHDVIVDPNGGILFCDRSNHRVRRIDQAGTITTIAGDGTGGFAGDGGAATSASLNQPAGICFDSAGNLYIADVQNHRIRRVDLNGIITTIAGDGVARFAGDDGAATAASVSFPTGVAVDNDGNVVIADNGNNRIRRISAADGVITTIAGTGVAGLSGDGGPATAAEMRIPYTVVVEPDGGILLTEPANNVIRRITTAGLIERVAGDGTAGRRGNGRPALEARFRFPQGLALGPGGTIYVADRNNGRVRRITR